MDGKTGQPARIPNQHPAYTAKRVLDVRPVTGSGIGVWVQLDCGHVEYFMADPGPRTWCKSCLHLLLAEVRLPAVKVEGGVN